MQKLIEIGATSIEIKLLRTSHNLYALLQNHAYLDIAILCSFIVKSSLPSKKAIFTHNHDD